VILWYHKTAYCHSRMWSPPSSFSDTSDLSSFLPATPFGFALTIPLRLDGEQTFLPSHYQPIYLDPTWVFTLASPKRDLSHAFLVDPTNWNVLDGFSSLGSINAYFPNVALDSTVPSRQVRLCLFHSFLASLCHPRTLRFILTQIVPPSYLMPLLVNECLTGLN